MLQEKEGFLADRPLIVHGFSIGAFVWGQFLVEMAKADDADSDNDNVHDESGDSMTSIDINDDNSPPSSSQVNHPDHNAAAADAGECDQRQYIRLDNVLVPMPAQ